MDHLDRVDGDQIDGPTPAGDLSVRQAGRRTSGHGSTVMRLRPTRHSSLDASYLQHRVYAAAQVLERSGTASTCYAPLGTVAGSKQTPADTTTPNEGIEIAWVWPPCLANDLGPVEFAVNVAPSEWVKGKFSHRRVPCWPVSGLALHITCGEQLLQIEELDICGTTQVRLHLPEALTAPRLNFITVILMDHGRVGPATQLLTMPSSAADEFSGLFRTFVENEILPETAAHPEFISMLFGSSGCSSGSTVRSFRSMRSISGGSHDLATSAAGLKARTHTAHSRHGSTGRGSTGSVSVATPLIPEDSAVTPSVSCVGQQQQGLPLHFATWRTSQRRMRRYSTGFLYDTGPPAGLCVRPGPAAGLAHRVDPPEPSDLSAAAAEGPLGSPAYASIRAPTAVGRPPRRRRASAGDALMSGCPSVAELLAAGGAQGFSTLLTIQRNLEALSVVPEPPAAAMVSQSLPDNGLVQGSNQTAASGWRAVQSQQGEEVEEQDMVLCGEGAEGARRQDGRAAVCTEGAATAVVTAAPAAALLPREIEEQDSIKKLQSAEQQKHRLQMSRDIPADEGALQQPQQQQQACQETTAQQQQSRKSFSLDKCSVHVHNEIQRGQHTRSWLSMDEGTRTASGKQLQHVDNSIVPAGDVTTGPGWALGASSRRSSRCTPAGQLTSQGAYPETQSAREAVPSSAAAAAAESVDDFGNGSGDAAAAAGRLPAADTYLVSDARDGPEAYGLQQSLSRSKVLERRTVAEAGMAVAFTTAWTCHMLELAADLQYLVVCVPHAFANNLEAWFCRIIDSRSVSGSNTIARSNANSSTAAGGLLPLSPHSTAGGVCPPDKKVESIWDSAMYLKRLNMVLDTLQEHKMWTTMSLLLQHCSLGGLDLYPAGRLYQHLQQQQQQQPCSSDQGAQGSTSQPPSSYPLLPSQQQQQQQQGPLDPGVLTPQYLEHLQALHLGPAGSWVRAVPAVTTARHSQAGTATQQKQPPAAQHSGDHTAQAATDLPTAHRRRVASSIDLTPSDLAQARAAAAAAVPAAAVAAGMAGRASTDLTGTACSCRPQSHRRGPKGATSWPWGVLHSAFSWAQTAQVRHRQRSVWQRAWGLHALREGSERGSESSAASSIDASSFRSSSSTQRSSAATSLEEAASWPCRVSAGLNRMAIAPTAAVVAAAAAAAARSSQQLAGKQRHSAGRGSTTSTAEVPKQATPACADTSSTGTDSPATSGVLPAAASVLVPSAGVSHVDLEKPGNAAACTVSRTTAADPIAALQSSLFCQAALPLDKVKCLKLAAEARVRERQQQQQEVPVEQMVPAEAQGVVTGASGSSAVQLSADVMISVETSAAQLDQRPHPAASCSPGDGPSPQQGAVQPVTRHPAVATAAVQPGATEAAARESPSMPTDSHSPAKVTVKLQSSAQRSAKSKVTAEVAERRAAAVAAALTTLGEVEHRLSQGLMLVLVLYCWCFLPSIMPGLQPPHLVAAMSRRSAWIEGLLLLSIITHWMTVTNVSIARPSSKRPRTSCAAAHHAAVEAVAAAKAVLAAAAAAAGSGMGPAETLAAPAVTARKLRRREEHKLQKLQKRQQLLLHQAIASIVAGVAALALLSYSLYVFACAWTDHLCGRGAAALWLCRS